LVLWEFIVVLFPLEHNIEVKQDDTTKSHEDPDDNVKLSDHSSSGHKAETGETIVGIAVLKRIDDKH
jgi:hypothetical protein